MANARCRCQRCTIHGLMGPAILITIGVLFLIQQSTWRFGFWQTWPVILLVVGAIKLGEALSSTEGHIGPVPPMQQQPMQPPPFVPPPPPPPPPAPRV
jgi:hypothetical protein